MAPVWKSSLSWETLDLSNFFHNGFEGDDPEISKEELLRTDPQLWVASVNQVLNSEFWRTHQNIGVMVACTAKGKESHC